MPLKISFVTEGIILILFCFVLVFVVSCKSKNKKILINKFPESPKTGTYLKEVFKTQKGDLNYNVLYPNGFDNSKKYPVLLFLHGAGERGNDNEAQLVHGGDLIKKGMNMHNSIAIFPQCPEDEYWIDIVELEERPGGIRNFEPDVNNPPSKALAKVMKLMNAFVDNDYVDKSRIYVAGLSMGGMGTFDLCWRMPNMFAAANAICGAGSTEKAGVFSKLPIRIFHGDIDEVVAVEESLDMIQALKEAGGNPEVFLYPDVNHNSWDNAFGESDFLSWFYTKERK